MCMKTYCELGMAEAVVECFKYIQERNDIKDEDYATVIIACAQSRMFHVVDEAWNAVLVSKKDISAAVIKALIYSYVVIIPFRSNV